MDKIKKIGPVFIVVASLLWSLDGLLRRSLFTLPPAVIVFFEHILGAILLLPFALRQMKEIKTLSKKEWIALGVVSLFSGALGTILYTGALIQVHFIQFSVVSLLQQLQPIWAITVAALLLKEKVSRRFIFWALLAIIGSYFVTFKNLNVNISRDGATIAAALMAISAGAMWGSSTSFSKVVLKKVSHITATFLRFIMAPLWAFIIILFLGQTTSMAQITTPQLGTLLLIALTTGMVALLIYYYGLRNTKAQVSAICELTWPVSAIIIDFVYLKNPLSVTQLIGAAVVLFSIYKVSMLKK
ncbi:MAG: DMT family transporter [Patescibacteria group bacterium]